MADEAVARVGIYLHVWYLRPCFFKALLYDKWDE